MGPLPATVTGTLFSDTDGDGIQDAGEGGISGYTMYAIDVSTLALRTTTTDENGTYTFNGIPASPRITLIQTGYFPSGHTITTEQFAWYVTPASNSATTLNVGFHPVTPSERVTLNVTVYRDADADGTRDAGEAGVPDARIAVFTYTTGEWYALFTGADGTVSKTDLIPADFFAAADPLPAGYARATSPVINDAEGNLLAIGQVIVDDPAPGSTHAMEVGLVPAP